MLEFQKAGAICFVRLEDFGDDNRRRVLFYVKLNYGDGSDEIQKLPQPAPPVEVSPGYASKKTFLAMPRVQGRTSSQGPLFPWRDDRQGHALHVVQAEDDDILGHHRDRCRAQGNARFPGGRSHHVAHVGELGEQKIPSSVLREAQLRRWSSPSCSTQGMLFVVCRTNKFFLGKILLHGMYAWKRGTHQRPTFECRLHEVL